MSDVLRNMYVRKHVIDAIIEGCNNIRLELSTESPSRVRAGRYKAKINRLFYIHLWGDYDTRTITKELFQYVEGKGDIDKYVTKLFDDLGITIVDKPNTAEVLSEYFKEIDIPKFIESANKIIEVDGCCGYVNCSSCPLTIANLSEEFLKYYPRKCTSFGTGYHSYKEDKVLVRVMKKFLQLSKK